MDALTFFILAEYYHWDFKLVTDLIQIDFKTKIKPKLHSEASAF